MGAGEFLSKGAPPNIFRIECPNEKGHWRAHNPGDQIRPSFAGTPVIIDGDLFEVTEHHPPTTSDGMHLYLLAAWEERNPIRGQCFEYSEQALREEQSQLAQQEAHDQVATRLNLCGVLVALLPASDQERLAQRYGFEAVFWTRWSALLFTILWFGAGIVTLTFHARSPSAFSTLLVIGAFLVEQFYRRGKAMVGQPCGSMIGYLFRPLVSKL